VQERLKAGKKVAVLVLGEDLYADVTRSDFDKGSFDPESRARDVLLSGLKDKGVPVDFAGAPFDHRSHSNFGGERVPLPED
jgi:hypothetical protein